MAWRWLRSIWFMRCRARPRNLAQKAALRGAFLRIEKKMTSDTLARNNSTLAGWQGWWRLAGACRKFSRRLIAKEKGRSKFVAPAQTKPTALAC